VAGRRVVIRLQVRRFFCDGKDCAVRTFAEQVDGLTVPYRRRTTLLQTTLEAIAVALAGRAGARLASMLGLSVGRNTLLLLVRALPDPEIGTVAVLGVDDFSLVGEHLNVDHATVLTKLRERGVPTRGRSRTTTIVNTLILPSMRLRFR
jgi:hypothetical protein